jgi:hypothetical protein
MSIKRLAKGKRIQIRKQKADIRKNADTKEEADGKIRDLITKSYKNK